MVFAAGRGYGKSAALRALSWMTVNEMRETLGMANDDLFSKYYINNNWATNSTATTTTSTLLYNGNYMPQKYVVSYDAAIFEPAKPKAAAKPKPETDMAWLKRRIAEVSWVPV